MSLEQLIHTPLIRWLFLLAFVIAIFVAIQSYQAATKITDPSDPRFDPMKFSFRDYSTKRGNEWDLPAALLKMFPPGTDRAYVEKILVGVAGAEIIRAKNRTNTYSIRWPSFNAVGGYAIGVEYGKNEKTESLFLGSNRLYEGPDYKKDIPAAIQKIEEEKNGKPENESINIEKIMAPIRKKYIGIESGMLGEEKHDDSK